MNTEILRIYLPAFMMVFLIVVYAWSHFRRGQLSVTRQRIDGRISDEIKIVNGNFRILFVAALALSALYAFLPQHYHFTGPIELMDQPVINVMGLLILNASLVWIVVAQFNVEKTVGMLLSGLELDQKQKLVDNSQRLMLTGMFIMFLGLFITISSAASILICLVAVTQFARLFGYV